MVTIKEIEEEHNTLFDEFVGVAMPSPKLREKMELFIRKLTSKHGENSDELSKTSNRARIMNLQTENKTLSRLRRFWEQKLGI